MGKVGKTALATSSSFSWYFVRICLLNNTYLPFKERDVPPEYMSEVMEKKTSMSKQYINKQLVLFFGRPLRLFGWALPRDGEIAAFNMEMMV